MPFTNAQLARYSRNILLEGVGPRGQMKLMQAKVLVIGAGGLGAPAMLYLATAGVGTIGVADADLVDVSNLQRQIIHTTASVGRPKVDSAVKAIEAVNPDVKVNRHYEYVMADGVMDLIAGYDFVIDATDNFPAKFLINDACVIAKKPFCHAGILGFEGQVMTWTPSAPKHPRLPCYRCVFKSPPPKDAVPSTAEAGVLGTLAGIVGSIQATEALKYILGIGELLTGRVLTVNALTMEFRTVHLAHSDPNCPVCGRNPTITKPVDPFDMWFPII